jgi:Lrp/AsnC family leucine-responsive transcriptional regulator
MDAVQGIDEITECYNTSGEFDFILKIQTRDMDSYPEFMRKKLGNIESVGYFHSIFVMKEVKNTHGVPVIIQEKSEDSE